MMFYDGLLLVWTSYLWITHVILSGFPMISYKSADLRC